MPLGVSGMQNDPEVEVIAIEEAKKYECADGRCKTQRELDLIQDPAAKLVPKEKVSVVRYLLAQGEWRKAAAAGSSAEGTQEVGS